MILLGILSNELNFYEFLWIVKLITDLIENKEVIHIVTDEKARKKFEEYRISEQIKYYIFGKNSKDNTSIQNTIRRELLNYKKIYLFNRNIKSIEFLEELNLTDKQEIFFYHTDYFKISIQKMYSKLTLAPRIKKNSRFLIVLENDVNNSKFIKESKHETKILYLNNKNISIVDIVYGIKISDYIFVCESHYDNFEKLVEIVDSTKKDKIYHTNLLTTINCNNIEISLNTKSSSLSLVSNLIQIKNNNINWQIPNATEKTVSDELIASSNNLPYHVNYVHIPWANVLEYSHKYQDNLSKVFEIYKYDLTKFVDRNKLNITVFQSYHIWKYVPQLKKLGIDVVFSPHSEIDKANQAFLQDKLLVLPIFLLPIITPNYDLKKNIDYIRQNPNFQKTNLRNRDIQELQNFISNPCSSDKIKEKYLSSFIGTVKYSQVKCTELRQALVNQIKDEPEVYCNTLSEWHFNYEVYTKQLGGKTNEMKEILKRVNEINYYKVMSESKTVLCPLGIGPNSIRLSETFIFGKVPVLISDNIQLPNYKLIEKGMIVLSEQDIKDNKVMSKLRSVNINEKLKFVPEIKKYVSKLSNPIFDYFSDERFILVNVMFFCPPGEKREELKYCYENNIRNDLIKKIVVNFEIINNQESSQENSKFTDNQIFKKIYTEFEYLKHSKIDVLIHRVDSPKKVSVNNILKYINKKYFGEKIILANNDIFYDQSLNLVKKHKLLKLNQIIALTRNDCFDIVLDNGNIRQKKTDSQDSWIFVAPVKVPKEELYMGWIRFDNKLSGHFHLNGYNISNPTEYVNSYHYQRVTYTNQSLQKKFIHNIHDCYMIGFTKVNENSKCEMMFGYMMKNKK